jgi:hypothetical protein
MKIKIAELLKESQVVENKPENQIDFSALEKEFGLTEEDIMQPPYASGKLQREFDKKNNPEKLVVIDSTGQLWSVMQEKEGVFVGPISMKYEIPGYTPYSSLDEAEKSLPAGWEVHDELTKLL